MPYEWIESAALSHKGVQKQYQAEWEADKYLLAGKMFAFAGSHKDGRPIVTLKLPPADGEALRAQYEDIIPGYYMNKVHWNSVYLDGAVPQALVEQMLAAAYRALLQSLPKKTQAEFL